MAQARTETFILIAAVIFSLVTFPTSYMTVTAVIAVVTYIVSKSMAAVLGIFTGAIFLRLFMKDSPTVIAPAGANGTPSIYTEQQPEGFQPKDPITINQRIEKNKSSSPLQPKASNITGVLESPEILDALQISEVRPVEQGAAMNTRPASLNVMAPEIIPTPPELTPSSATGSLNVAPQANPVLQNGHDNESIMTALISKGSSLMKGFYSSNVPPASTSGPSAP